MTLDELLDELSDKQEGKAKMKVVLVDEWDNEMFDIDSVEFDYNRNAVKLRFNSYGRQF